MNHDSRYEGRDRYFADIDRMINEGLGGGRVHEDGSALENQDLLPEAEPRADIHLDEKPPLE